MKRQSINSNSDNAEPEINHIDKKIRLNGDVSKKNRMTSNDNRKAIHNNIARKRKDLTKEKLSLKTKRKNHNDMIDAVKKLFEEVRRRNCPPAKRIVIVNKLTDILMGNLIAVVRKRTISRIVQWMIKLGSSETHNLIFNELKAMIPELAKGVYTHHIVSSLVEFSSPTIRSEVINILLGEDVLSLMNCKLSAEIVDKIYKMYATPNEKTLLAQSISGRILRGFNDTKITLTSVPKTYPEIAPVILSSTKTNLLKLVQNDWCAHSLLITSVLGEFIGVCSKSDRCEIFDAIKPKILELLLTQKGCNISIKVMGEATAKEKKIVIKRLHENLKTLAKTKNGSYFILSLFDTVDDTVLMKKLVMSKLMDDLPEIIMHEYSRRIPIYLFLHKNAKSCFTPTEFDLLTHLPSEHIKKDSTQRLNELRDGCVLKMVQCIKEKPNIWILNVSVGLLTGAIIRYCTETSPGIEKEIKEAFIAISEYIVNFKGKVLKKKKFVTAIIEDSQLHVTLKTIIRNDADRFSKNLITFSECFVQNLSNNIVIEWLNFNRGCFTFIMLLESSVTPAIEAVKTFLQDPEAIAVINKEKTVGAKLLKEKLQDHKKI